MGMGNKDRRYNDTEGMRARKGARPCRECEVVDFKDTHLLRRFLSAQGKIYSRKRVSNCSQCQRKVTLAVKRARFMGLLSYTG
jgi:small subunit ribosomal protein S18